MVVPSKPWSSSTTSRSASTLDYYARSRIDARIAAITPTVLELRRQGIRDEDATRGKLQYGVSAHRACPGLVTTSQFRHQTVV